MHPVSGRQDLYSPSEHYCMFQVGSLHGHRRRLGTRCLTPSLQAVPIPKIFDGHQGYTAAVMGVSAALQDRKYLGPNTRMEWFLRPMDALNVAAGQNAHIKRTLVYPNG
jgi:hypothetical protein